MFANRSSSSRALDTIPENSQSHISSFVDVSSIKDEEVKTLVDSIESLLERQKVCIKTLQFKEAAEIKTKVLELKKDVVRQRYKNIKKRHQEEMAQLLEAQNQEVTKVNEYWQEKLTEYDTEAGIIEQQMKEQHRENLESLKRQLTESSNVKPKKSPEHLHYLEIVNSLAKAGDFLDADKCMKKCLALEKEEMNKAKFEKERKMKTQSNNLEAKQNIEMKSLMQKMASGRDQLSKLMKEEQEKLQQKFKNMIQELESAQKVELSRFELAFKTYVPDDKFTLSPKKKGTMTSFTQGLKMSNSMIHTSNVDRSLDLPGNKTERNTPSEAKKSLLDLLITSKKTTKVGLPSSKRVGSYQRT